MTQKRIGRYLIKSELGRGGMGAVYLAHDPTLERDVALKLLPAYFAQEPEFSARFTREAKTVAGLDHQAIVAVYDYGEDDVWPYFVMRLMRGGSLKDRLAEGPLSLDQANQVLQRVAGALDKAHSKGIVHRDLKPGNILYDGEGNAYLSDFGIVRLAEGSEQFTRTGSALGTPAYMSPEQADALPDIDRRSDIYSLGVVLYELLAGETPFQHESRTRLLMMHLTAPVPNLLEARPDLPAGLQAVIEKAMAKERGERYQTAGELATAFQALISGAVAPSRPAARPAAAAVVGAATRDKAAAVAPKQDVQPAGEQATPPAKSEPPPVQDPTPAAEPAKKKSSRKAIIVLSGVFVLFAIVAIAAGAVVIGGGLLTDSPTPDHGDPVLQEPDSPAGDEPANPAGEEPGQGAGPLAADSCADDGLLCVGLVTDFGQVNDSSYSQAAWAGLERAAAELGAQIDVIESQDARDYLTNIEQLADQDYDIIVTIGFIMADATAEAAANYPAIDFIGVDQFLSDDQASNYAGLIFAEDKLGFAAGALAAMLTNSGVVAGVHGTDLVPPVVAYKEGYEAGALYIAPDISVISTYHPGGLDVAFSDPEWGAQVARQSIEQGADVVFGAGGSTSNGALIEAAGFNDVFCIGTEVDQWEVLPEAHSCLVSSVMKGITPGVFELIALSSQGALTSGNFLGEVALAPYHDFEDQIPQSIKDTMAEIEAGLNDGSISTGVGQ